MTGFLLRLRIPAVLWFGLPFLCLSAAAQQPAWLAHRPPASFSSGKPVELIVEVRDNIEWISAFFRIKGKTDFSSVSFEAAEKGTYKAEIDVSGHPAGDLEYYFTVRRGETIHYFPEKAPEELFRIAAEVSKPGAADPSGKAAASSAGGKSSSGEPSATPAKFPLSFDGSVDVRLIDKTEIPDESRIHYQTNLGLQYRNEQPGFAWAVDSRLSYTDSPLDGNNKIDLSQVRVEISTRGHTFRAGDISVGETEFSVGGLGRRGIEYQFDNQKLYLHLFTLNTQQLQGFKGLGLPTAGAAIFGGAAGFSLAEKAVSLKAVYLTGKDDPGLGGNNAYADWFKPRQGSVFAVVPEFRLFQGAFQLTAELALSKVDRDTTDSDPAQPGAAWRTNVRFSKGGFDVDGYYRRVNRDFDTIGQPFLTADRRELGGSVGFTIGPIRLNGGYKDEQTAGSEDPLDILSRNRRIDAGLALALGERVSVRFGYSQAAQDALQGNLVLPAGALTRNGFTAGLDLRLGPSASFMIDAQSDSIVSEQAPDKEGQSLSIGAGGTFGDGRIVSFNPGLRFSTISNPQTGEDTNIVNAFINGRLSIVQDWIFLSASGSYNNITYSGAAASTNWMIDGGLTLDPSRLIRIGHLGFSIRGSLLSATSMGISQSDYRLYGRLDYSF